MNLPRWRGLQDIFTGMRIMRAFRRWIAITPFITPKKGKASRRGSGTTLQQSINQNIAVVPQILTNQAEGFCKVAGMLKEQGYEEVNLNLGCPSATVTAKKKGAGFLADPDALDAFLEEIFAHSPLKISIKTRIGVENPDEFERLLIFFSQYPIQKLIVHPRVLKEFYKGNVHREAYVRAKERLSAAAADEETVERTIPVCYNGDLFSVSDTERFLVEYPGADDLMFGRGNADRSGAGDAGCVPKVLIRRKKTLQRNCAWKTKAQSGRTLRSEYRISAIFMGDWRRITQRCCPENGTYYLK